jgi:hypothetical protein
MKRWRSGAANSPPLTEGGLVHSEVAGRERPVPSWSWQGNATTLAPSIDALLKSEKDKFYDVRFIGGTGALGMPVRKAMMDDLW